MKSNKDLYELIQALTPAEKVHFKKVVRHRIEEFSRISNCLTS